MPLGNVIMEMMMSTYTHKKLWHNRKTNHQNHQLRLGGGGNPEMTGHRLCSRAYLSNFFFFFFWCCARLKNCSSEVNRQLINSGRNLSGTIGDVVKPHLWGLF